MVTRDEILSLFPDSLETFDRTVDSHLSHLRKNRAVARAKTVLTPAQYRRAGKLCRAMILAHHEGFHPHR